MPWGCGRIIIRLFYKEHTQTQRTILMSEINQTFWTYSWRIYVLRNRIKGETNWCMKHFYDGIERSITSSRATKSLIFFSFICMDLWIFCNAVFSQRTIVFFYSHSSGKLFQSTATHAHIRFITVTLFSNYRKYNIIINFVLALWNRASTLKNVRSPVVVYTNSDSSALFWVCVCAYL